MGRGVGLSREERASIHALSDAGFSEREVAVRVKRSKSAVHNALRARKGSPKKQKTGPKPKISPREERRLISHVRKNRVSANEARIQLQLPVCTRTVQLILHKAEFLEYRTLKKAPKMDALCRQNRIKWCRKYIREDARFWRHVIFSDEKRWCLDGPDAERHYWSDSRIERENFSKRRMGGRSLMVWGAISARGKSKLVMVDGTLDAVQYTEIMEDALMPMISDFYGGEDDWVYYQQDGASSHRAIFTREWLMESGITDIEWPAHSPDLNPIENLWGILVSNVYRSNRQFETLEDLKEAIWYVWENIDLSTVRNLLKSMPARVAEVLVKRGGPTSY